MEWKDGRPRCRWANPENPRYLHYHDREWGLPVHDDRMLFEMLILEGFQAGLSWECILNKRENFRRAFDGFDWEKVAAYGPEKREALAQDAGIVRNRRKIAASVGNARAFAAIRQEWGSFDAYLWHWTGGKSLRPDPAGSWPRDLAAVGRGLEGSAEARHEIRGFHHHLRLSAGGGGALVPRTRLLSL